MQRSARLALVAVAALAAAGITASLPTAVLAKDDAAELKKKRDDFRKKLKEEGKLPTHDLSYYFDAKAAKETRWSQTDPPPFQELSEKKGGQFYATWTAKEGSPPLIKMTMIKMITQEGNSKYSYEFPHAGVSVPVGDKKKMVQGFYDDWVKASTEPLKDKCSDGAKKVSAGPADLTASAVATDKESKKRERRDWYGWLEGGKTWIAIVEFPDYEKVETAKLGERALEFMKNLKEAKPPE